MDKFTVDLDAVLDEFEYHEGQANHSKANVSPTVSGFFSPTSEPGPSSLDQMKIAGSSVLDVVPHTEAHLPSTDESYPVKSLDTRYDKPFRADQSEDSKETENSFTAPAEAETIVPSDQGCTPPQIELEDDEVNVNSVINIADSSDSPPKSLADELMELENCLVPQPAQSVQEGNLESIAAASIGDPHLQAVQEDEDYVDERQLTEYLKQLEMEKFEEKLIEENIPGSNESTPNEDESVRTGAKPKQKPTITPTTDHTDPNPDQSVCGGGYDGMTISEEDLRPVIGTHPTESPPPYSEVDPINSSEAQKPTRPLTLDLEPSVRGSAGNEEDAGDTSDDTSISAGDPILGAPGETPANPSGPRLGHSNLLDGLSEDQLMLGKLPPFWVPDTDTINCMICSVKFTVVKRRHHCRACGKVLCSGCCSEKSKLVYMENKEGRVCTPCKAVLDRLEKAENSPWSSQSPQPSRPNPANPMEYCSRIPVSEQISSNTNTDPPSVMVPVGVLKRNPSTSEGSLSRPENKSVMFSDGIRPGGDLTELDGGSDHRPLGKRPGKGKPRKIRTKSHGSTSGDVCSSRIPSTGLPFVSGKGKVEDEEISVWFSAGTSVNFVVNNNLTVLTKRVKYAPINKFVWNFASRGLTSVGQDEVVILLETEEDEQLPPRDIFLIIQTIYEQAGAGQPVLEMGHITVNPDFLGSNSHGGWLFIRHTFQAVTDLFLPPPPVLFGILVMRWEIPWARIFPLRLMLRLGAEFRYYPSPLVSTRNRKPVYGEIGHTIMKVLSDFKNYAYTLPTIRGLVIHMSSGRTLILIPKNRHDAVSKALNNSNDAVLALGANFSMSVDSHLVAIQNDEGSYQTQAINIQHKERVVTGASFVVFNGALKSTANLTAKSSIVEDGIMVQVLPDHMIALRKNLQQMEDVDIGCGPVGAEQPDEVVSIKWVDEDKAFNIGIKSVIDDMPMDGIGSLRIHCGPDMRTDQHILRWTEVFLLKVGEPNIRGREHDPTRVAEGVARAVGVALTPLLATLKSEGLSPLAVRVSLDQDNVAYEAGAGGKPLPGCYMNNLDNELIPLIHSAATNSLVIELIFHVLDQ